MTHPVVSREEWLQASRALLAEEKAWTRERDRVARKRPAPPWVRVEQDYVFEGADGPVTLSELFDGRSQLIVYHFMFGPDWDEGCVGCSLLCDQVDGARQHFEHKDVSWVAVSRGPSVTTSCRADSAPGQASPIGPLRRAIGVSPSLPATSSEGAPAAIRKPRAS